MHAITVRPTHAGSAALALMAEPSPADGTVLVETLAVGICGTDVEIVAGLYGAAPPGHDQLVLGHESIGRVLEAPDQDRIRAGDLVVGVVRRPDPVPCSSCAAGEWDMCLNGRYTEHGIKELNGFGAERFRAFPEELLPVAQGLGLPGVLVEPASVVAKAWEQIGRIGVRAHWEPRTVLVTGAGPVGLLAALFGTLRGLEVHVFDRAADGPKPALVKALGASYHHGSVKGVGRDFDVALECTGSVQVVWDVMHQVGPNGICCLTGVSSGGRKLEVDVGALNRELVLENNVVFGTVNANLRHYQAAADVLAQADPAWLEQVIARRVPVRRWADALIRQPHDVKTIVQFATL